MDGIVRWNTPLWQSCTIILSYAHHLSALLAIESQEAETTLNQFGMAGLS